MPKWIRPWFQYSEIKAIGSETFGDSVDETVEDVDVTGMVKVQNSADISNQSLQELRNLAITQVSWNDIFNIEFTLSNGQFCNAGTDFRYDQNHFFDFREKITRIEVIIMKNELSICQMNFYHNQQRLVAVGYPDDFVEGMGGRVEVFEIGEDERLIGCKLGK